MSMLEDAKNIAGNIQKRGLKDVLNPEVWSAYSDWKQIEKEGLLLKAEDIDAFCEQYVYRKLKCPECVSKGKCVDCNCPTIPKMVTAESKCTMGFWDKMLPPDEWEQHKKDNGITLLTT